MKNPNGYGTVKKLSGKRRRPYAAYITTGYESKPQARDILFLQNALSWELYKQVREEYERYIKYTVKGKQVQKCIGYFETRQEALICLAEYNKNPYDIDNKDITFKEIYLICYDTIYSKKSATSCETYVSAYKKCSSIENIPMRKIRKQEMQNVLDENTSMSASTLSNLITLFRSIFNYCMENDIVEKDYSQYLTFNSTQEKRIKYPFERDEIKKLWNNTEYSFCSKSDKVAMLDDLKLMDSVLIMIYSGLRINELLDLKASDLHLKERYIDLRGTKTASARRIVPIHKRIQPLLEKRFESARDDSFLFVTNDGERIPNGTYRNYFFNPMCSEILKKEHTPHECRHSFSTYAEVSGMNDTYRKKMFGHKCKDITKDVYTHVLLEDLIKEIDKLEIV